MMNLSKAGKGMPIPDMGDFQLAFGLAQNTFAALSNHVQGGATISAAAVVPYTPITSPLITRKASGIFLVYAAVTISINGGSLADADVVTFNLTRVTPGAVALPAIWRTGATTSTGGGAGQTVVAYCAGSVFDLSGVAQGATASYGLTITNTNAHTSGVVATTDGNIYVIELPG
jgi:hypothetical protein